MQSCWQQQLLLRRGGKGKEGEEPFLPGSNPILTLPHALGEDEKGRVVLQGPLDLDLVAPVENAPLEGLGVQHGIWHSSQMEYFSFVPL